MGASNQEMVSNLHLNRMGVTGAGKAYFFKPMQHLGINRMIERARLVRILNPLIINQVDYFRGALPPNSPPTKTNPLLLLRLMKIIYGFSNRNDPSVGALAAVISRKAPLPPPPIRSTAAYPHENIFRKTMEAAYV